MQRFISFPSPLSACGEGFRVRRTPTKKKGYSMPNLRFAADKERRLAIVTGGARGIGAASALRIAEEGRDIVIADVEDSSAVVRQIEEIGQSALFIKTDVSDEAAVHQMVAQAV